MGKIKTSILYLPRPAAKYPGCYPLWFEKRIPDILESTDYIHLFAGMATTGTRIDINSSVYPHVVADNHALPFPDNLFNGGMADPPYTREFAKSLYNTEYPRWKTWSAEMARVIIPSSRLAIMHNYIVPQVVGCKVEEIIVILTRIKQYPKIVTVQRKT